MAGVVVVAIALLGIAVVAGGLTVIVLGIRREDDGTLAHQVPGAAAAADGSSGRVSKSARRATGYIRIA